LIHDKISSLYLQSRSPEAPLRVGILLDSWTVPRVFRSVLTDINASNFARVELVAINSQPSRARPVSSNRIVRLLNSVLQRDTRRKLMFTLYSRAVDRCVCRPDPLEDVDVSDLLGGVPVLKVQPVSTRFVHRFPPEAIASIRSFNLDVILRFGFNILRGEILTSARRGVWSFHHGDNDEYRGGPPLFWEVVEDNPYSGVILQVLTEKLDDGIVLCKSVFGTRRGLSWKRNIPNPYWGSSHFVIRKLHQLHENGWEAVRETMVPSAPYRGKTAVYRAPTNTQVARWLLPRIARKIVEWPFRRVRTPHWRICLRKTDGPELMTGAGSTFSNYRWMPDKSGHYYADPVLVQHEDRQIWLFFEDFSRKTNRGTICCASVGPDLTLGPVTSCLDLPYHLSYPMVFRHQGETYMIPESQENRTVDLFRATRFPDHWTLERTLFQGAAVDTTPFFHDGRWYFFTTLCEPRGNAAFGVLYHSGDLLGEWSLHPDSPISTDVRYARSAGPVHTTPDGRIFRPVQDCGEDYGRRIHIEEILELTPSKFRNRTVRSIEPHWEPNLRGTHTYGFCAGIETLDALFLINP